MITKKHEIKIKEDTEQVIVESVLNEVFFPSAEKVRLVKDFIDKNFVRVEVDDIDGNGYPKKDKMVSLIGNGQALKTMSLHEMLLMLDDKFHTMISNQEDRMKFLKQVITDWYNRKLSDNGMLSVNIIK